MNKLLKRGIFLMLETVLSVVFWIFCFLKKADIIFLRVVGISSIVICFLYIIDIFITSFARMRLKKKTANPLIPILFFVASYLELALSVLIYNKIQ